MASPQRRVERRRVDLVQNTGGTGTDEQTSWNTRRRNGFREEAILSAAFDVLLEVGYDRLTMEAVAARAGASKATLYRHWDSKGPLVVDALARSVPSCEVPDTGSLAGDLRALGSQVEGFLGQRSVTAVGAVVTAVMRDPWFAAELRSAFVAPRVDAARDVWRRAAMRGDLRDDLDLDLVEHALGGIVLSHVLLMGHDLTVGLVARAIDRVIVPSASR